MVVSIYTAGAQTTEEQASGILYLPKIDIALKTKAELDLESKMMRFEVRNARFGARGNINEYVGYRIEVDLSDEGKIKMLDAFVKITPLENLDVYMGQRKVPFGTDYLRSPVENFFANRSFVSKYTNDGLRDIGFVVNYRFKFHIPFDVWVAAMNGTGNNNPQWISRPNYSARLLFEPLKNIRLAGNFNRDQLYLKKNSPCMELKSATKLINSWLKANTFIVISRIRLQPCSTNTDSIYIRIIISIPGQK